MSYLILLIAMYSLLCVHASYGQEIAILNPYGQASRIANAKELSEASREKLRSVLVGAQEGSSLFMYAFDYQSEQRGTPEIYDGEAYGSGKLMSESPLKASSIVGSCVNLLNEKKDGFVHLLSHNDYFTSSGSSERSYVSSLSKEYALHSGKPEFMPKNIRKTDTIIYVIGDDSPIKHPFYESITVAEWYGVRINTLKNRCKSVLVLISKNRYNEIAPTINKLCHPANFDTTSEELIPTITVFYRPSFIFSLGIVTVCLVAGIFYRFFLQ